MSLLSDLSRELAALAATGRGGRGRPRASPGPGLRRRPLAGRVHPDQRARGPRRGRAARPACRAAPSPRPSWSAPTSARTSPSCARDTRGPPPLQLADSRGVQVGQLVMAIGNPLGLDRSVSLGVVSALYRELPTRDGVLEGLIQTDAAVNPGHSGGPLLDMDGRVVGINTAMLTPARGIGFAVPAHTASWVAAVLIQHGEVRRPYLGIRARSEELEPALARDAGQARGVRVVGVEPGTPAAAGGLERRRPPAGRQRRAGVHAGRSRPRPGAGAARPRSTSRSCAGRSAPPPRGEAAGASGLTHWSRPGRTPLLRSVHASGDRLRDDAHGGRARRSRELPRRLLRMGRLRAVAGRRARRPTARSSSGQDALQVVDDPDWTVVRSIKRLLADAGPLTEIEAGARLAAARWTCSWPIWSGCARTS